MRIWFRQGRVADVSGDASENGCSRPLNVVRMYETADKRGAGPVQSTNVDYGIHNDGIYSKVKVLGE